MQLQEPRKPVERVLPIWIHGCKIKLMIYLKYVSCNVFYQRLVTFYVERYFFDMLFLCACFFVHFVVGIVCKCRFMCIDLPA